MAAQPEATGESSMTDSINHPRHYRSHPSGVECIEIAEHMGFCVGNAMKYLWRAGLKDGTDQLTDLRKAAWYIQREIERLEKAAHHEPLLDATRNASTARDVEPERARTAYRL